MAHPRRSILSLVAICVSNLAAASELGNPDHGQQLFSRCSGCHSLQSEDKAGPSLNGVVGRKAASVDGYRYSPALLNSGITWNEDTLSKYLSGPTNFVRGTRMSISVTNEQDRKDIISYLKSLGGK